MGSEASATSVDRGRATTLMLDRDRSDRSTRDPVTKRARTSTATGRNRESGQAMVEFALILFPLLLLVVGIIQFGIALNFWLDMNRIANQGARFAAVNCGPTTSPAQCTPSLQAWLTEQALSKGNNPTVTICYENGKTGSTADVGDAVRVELTQPFTFRPIVTLGTIDLNASATMRLEQKPSKGNLTSHGACT